MTSTLQYYSFQYCNSNLQFFPAHIIITTIYYFLTPSLLCTSKFAFTFVYSFYLFIQLFYVPLRWAVQQWQIVHSVSLCYLTLCSCCSCLGHLWCNLLSLVMVCPEYSPGSGLAQLQTHCEIDAGWWSLQGRPADRCVWVSHCSFDNGIWQFQHLNTS